MVACTAHGFERFVYSLNLSLDEPLVIPTHCIHYDNGNDIFVLHQIDIGKSLGTTLEGHLPLITLNPLGVYDKDLVFMVRRDGVQVIQLIELDDVTKPFVLEPCFQILQECAIISLLVGTDNSAVAK